MKALKDKTKEPEVVEPEPEPTTEVLFLCSYEGCAVLTQMGSQCISVKMEMRNMNIIWTLDYSVNAL